MRSLKAQGMGNAEIGKRLKRSTDSVSDFISREKRKAAKAF